MTAVILPALVLLAGMFIGLVLGALMARGDLRALETELAELRPSDPSGSEPLSAAPSQIEGR
jgi:hypothetical protein